MPSLFRRDFSGSTRRPPLRADLIDDSCLKSVRTVSVAISNDADGADANIAAAPPGKCRLSLHRARHQHQLIKVGRRKYPQIAFLVGDAEHLPFADASFDGVLLSGMVHHFPDPSRCAAEVGRVVRRRGRFMAFDPNRMNPVMWLYRDDASPFYSPVGVTENERPVLAGEVAAVFTRAGFDVSSHYLSGLAYRYVASARARLALPIYNVIDAAVFGLPFMRRLRPFVLTVGEKR
jgi:SAM-dependent methyltransferase